MRKIIKIAGILIAALIACAAASLFTHLPADNKESIARKYTGWSGVLQAGICSRWSAAGSFTRWLNRCAADFEKAHDGVYIEFMECDEGDISGIFEIYTPDMFFFSPGVITDASEARAVQRVCMGGYALAYNRSMAVDHLNPTEHIQPDTAANCYSAAAIALCGSKGDASVPDGAMDIGLQAGNTDADPFSLFTAGEIACIAVSTRDISRLQKLSDSGRGPDWALTYPDGAAFTDQLLYMMTPSHLPDDGRAAIISEFSEFLLTAKCQAYLSDIGAIPVCGESIYPAHSPYAVVEAWLDDETITPQAFSEYCAADCADIVRSFSLGESTRADAISAIIKRRAC